MCLSPSKCKIRQDWQEPVSALSRFSDRLEVIDSFKHVGNLITPGSVGGEVASRSVKAREILVKYDSRGGDMTSGSHSREECIRSQSVVFFTVTRPDISAPTMPDDFVFNHR